MIAETNNDSTFAAGIRQFILTALAAALFACRPGTDFKVSVRVLDETTGRPIPDAWVLVSARVDVEPEREPPYNRALAAARDRTDSRGVAVLRTLEGLYWGEEPKDELWKMLAAREPKVERRISLLREGDLFVFAKDYGVLHHPLKFKGIAIPKDVPGLGLMGVKGEGTILELDPADIGKGLALTVKMVKPEHPEYLLASFSPESLWLFAGLATTGATGTSKKEKAAVYDFFVENLKPLLAQSTASYRGHMAPESIFDPKVREQFINHAPEQVHNHETIVHEWMTQKALELLPPGYDEVKQYAREIQAGVKAEDEGMRALNHFYNPYDPGNAMALGEPALKWGAVGYPDNPNNEWDWHDAQRYYREGNKAKAYKALGHVLHLLEDLSVPMHTHVIAHHSLIQRSAARYELYFGELAKANGGMLPAYSMGATAPKKVNTLAKHFGGLAKMTFGTIPGDRTAIDVAAFYKWEKGGIGTQVREPDEMALEIMGRWLLPAGIAHGAGLLARFLDDFRPALSATAPNTREATDAGGSQSGAGPDVLPEWRTYDEWKVEQEGKVVKSTAPKWEELKIDIAPVTPSVGIASGFVIAYGHFLKQPYVLSRSTDGSLLVNGIQVDPSLVAIRNARRKSKPLSSEMDKHYEEVSRLVSRLDHMYWDGIKAGRPKEVLKARVVEEARSHPHVFKIFPHGDRAFTMTFRPIEGRQLAAWYFQFSETEPVPEPEVLRQSRYRRLQQQENEELERELRAGRGLFFTSKQSDVRVEPGFREAVNRIMADPKLSPKEKHRRLFSGPMSYGGYSGYNSREMADDVMANYDPAEWGATDR